MTEKDFSSELTWRDLKDARQKGLQKKKKAIEKSVKFLNSVMDVLRWLLGLEDNSMIVFQKKEVYERYYHIADGGFLDENSMEMVDGYLIFYVAICFNYTTTTDIHPLDLIYQSHDEYECFLFGWSWHVDEGVDVYDVDSAKDLKVNFLDFSRVYNLERFKLEDVAAAIAIKMVHMYMDIISKNPCDPRLRVLSSAYPNKVTL